MKDYYEGCLHEYDLDPADYTILGDKLFVNRPPSFQALLRNPQPGDEADHQLVDSVCRTSVEWTNGKVTENWKYITYKNKLRLNVHAIGRDMTVAAILTNAHTLCHGCNTHNFFQDENNPFAIEMPSLESYFEI